mmetsp:Transcript_1743/g.2840  ORF Transcript_1743/g.2840 Transcript_1743/m.2840 type:complete len:307 (-) Transcript_1743:2-922(-)
MHHCPSGLWCPTAIASASPAEIDILTHFADPISRKYLERLLGWSLKPCHGTWGCHGGNCIGGLRGQANIAGLSAGEIDIATRRAGPICGLWRPLLLPSSGGCWRGIRRCWRGIRCCWRGIRRRVFALCWSTHWNHPFCLTPVAMRSSSPIDVAASRARPVLWADLVLLWHFGTPDPGRCLRYVGDHHGQRLRYCLTCCSAGGSTPVAVLSTRPIYIPALRTLPIPRLGLELPRRRPGGRYHVRRYPRDHRCAWPGLATPVTRISLLKIYVAAIWYRAIPIRRAPPPRLSDQSCKFGHPKEKSTSRW